MTTSWPEESRRAYAPEAPWLGLPLSPWVAAGVLGFVLGFLVGYYRATRSVPFRDVSSSALLVGAVLGALLAAYAMLLPVAYQLLRSFGRRASAA
jgi:predicted PurR-regulated permease PerM